jgi:hypothetical protein
VDDVVTTTMSSSTLVDGTPAAGLSCWVAAAHSAFTAPVLRNEGTAVPFAGLVQVAFGARVIDLPGLPPRGAPV